MVSATSAVASRTRGPGDDEPATTKSTPFVRVFEPVVGRVTLRVSLDVERRSRSALRPCVISSRLAMGHPV